MGQAERNPRVIEEFKRRRSVQWKITIGVICCGVLLVMAQEWLRSLRVRAQEHVVMASVLSLIAVCVFLTFRNWRCRYLGKNLNPHFCPACGIPLQ